MGNVLVIGILLCAVGLAVRSIIRRKKNNACCGCTGNCANCRGH